MRVFSCAFFSLLLISAIAGGVAGCRTMAPLPSPAAAPLPPAFEIKAAVKPVAVEAQSLEEKPGRTATNLASASSGPTVQPALAKPTLKPRSGPVPPCNFSGWIGRNPPTALLAAQGRSWRIIEPGTTLVIDDDFQPQRVNLFIDERGTVSRIECW